MAEQANLGYVAQGREGTGEAQIYNTQPLTQQFTNYAMNYLQQKQEKERVAAQQKREDEKENAKNFAKDFEYNLETWQPFEQALRQKKDELVQDFTSELTKNPDFAKTYAVGSEAWQKAQKKKNEMESFVKRANDYKEEWQTASKQVLDLQKSGRYNTTEQLAKLRELADKQYEEIGDYSSGSIKEALSHPSMINPIGVAQDMVTKNLKNVQMEIDKYTREGNIGKVTKLKQNVPTFVKRTADGSIDMSTGQPEINPNDPSFIQFVNSDDEMSRRLDYDMEQALAKNPNLDKAKFRQEQALGYFNNLIAKENKVADANVQDETLEAARLAEQKRANRAREAQDRAEFEFKKGGSGAGTSTPAVAAINDLAKLMNKDSDRFTSTEVIGGKEYRVADASNVFGGNLDKKGTTDGRKLTKILIDVETGQLKYVDNQDKNNPKDLPENDFALLDNLLLSNLDKTERQAAIQYLEQQGAYDKNTGKMNFNVLKDLTVGQTGTGRDEKTFEATKKAVTTDFNTLSNREFVNETKKLFENYKGTSELEYEGEKYTDIEPVYEGDEDLAGNDIRIYGKNSKGQKVELGDFSKEALPKVLEGFKFKGQEQKTEAPKTETKPNPKKYNTPTKDIGLLD